MLRLIHNQTTLGALLVNDIDDGLPNKEVHRLTGDPKAYPRDGYANKPKQACYIPYASRTDAALKGYIDLTDTDRVTLSKSKGAIKKLSDAGYITAVSFVAGDVAAPTLATADKDTPGAGDLTLTGTNMTSLSPNYTSVILTGTGAITLTQTQITTGGGTVSATSIFIPAALIPGVATGTTSAQVKADLQLSAVVALS